MVNVVAVQPRIRLPYPEIDIFDANAVQANLRHSIKLIDRAKSEYDADLVTFPEFFLTGYTLGIDVAGWIKVSIQIPGPEIDILRDAAIKQSVYIAGTAYEVCDAFPGRFFNTSFVISPSGELVLVYRKLYAMTSKTRPVDILDQFIEEFGEDSLMPVADTPIGRIGAMIARDAHWPEMARCLALKGAEILYNPNAARAEPEDGGRLMRNSRAYENHCYLISPNIGPFYHGNELQFDGRAPTQIIDYRGRTIASKESPDELMVAAELDLNALRAFRTAGSGYNKGNFLAQLQPQIHLPIYQSLDLFPSNEWRSNPIQSNDENIAAEAQVVKRMMKAGILSAPETQKAG